MDLDEGHPRRADVELFIIHPAMTPTEITAALGLEAHNAHQVDHPRKTPKGRPLEGQYPDTRWRHSIRYELGGQWFADKITLLVDRLAAHKAFFHHVRATGGTAEIIVQFRGRIWSNGRSLRQVELQLDLGIECFDVPQLLTDWLREALSLALFYNTAKRVSAKQDGVPSRSSRPTARLRPVGFGAAASLASRAKAGGGRRTRTFEVIRRLIYSQLPLPLGTLPRLNLIGTHPPKRRQEGHG